MNDYLMLHQKEGIQFLRENKRCLLADEAGLGKTRQILEAGKLYLKRRKMLVICPTSIVPNWWEEINKWDFPKDKIEVIGLEAQFLKQLVRLTKGNWSVIVIDESHNFRNLEAQRTRGLIKLIKGRDSRVWFLSGTPVVKGAMDLFVTMSIIEPGKHGKFKDFQENYCQKKSNQWKPGGIEYYGIKNAKVLNASLSKVMIRRYKKDHLEDLPDKVISRIPLEIESRNFDIFTNDGIVRAVLKNVENAGRLRFDEDIAETIQELGIKKVDYVIKFIEDALFPHPLVIFAHHRIVLYDIAEKLKDKGRRVHVIIGGMDKDTKFKYIKEFQDGKVDDLVCGILAGGIGHNFFRSSRCVFAEFPWTWAALEQASDRLHRIGQKDCVNVYNCFASGTFEEKQLSAIEFRRSYTKETVGLK